LKNATASEKSVDNNDSHYKTSLMKLTNKHSKVFYVYELRDQGVPFYVGKGRGDRIKQHLQSASLKKHSHKNAKIKKMMSEGRQVEMEILSYHEDEACAFLEEIRIISLYGRENLTNNELGGQGSSGRIISEETRAKSSVAHKGRVKSPEECARLSAALMGVPFSEERKARLKLLRKPMSEETRRRMSESRKGKKRGPRPQWVKDKIGAAKRESLLRNPITDELRAKFSEAHKGRKWTPEQREKILSQRIGKKRKPFTDEHRKNLSESIRLAKAKPKQKETKSDESFNFKEG
jgi:hypothetical protein